MSQEEEQKKEKELKRKALEVYLSGRKNPGREDLGWEQPRKKLSEEDQKAIENLQVPTTTKDLKIRGRKKGIITPRQTVRIDESLWKQFIRKARADGRNASEVLRDFIYKYVHR